MWARALFLACVVFAVSLFFKGGAVNLEHAKEADTTIIKPNALPEAETSSASEDTPPAPAAAQSQDVSAKAEVPLAEEDTPPSPAAPAQFQAKPDMKPDASPGAATTAQDTTGSVLAEIKLVSPPEEPTMPKPERELGGSPAADRRLAMEAVKIAQQAAERKKADLMQMTNATPTALSEEKVTGDALLEETTQDSGNKKCQVDEVAQQLLKVKCESKKEKGECKGRCKWHSGESSGWGGCIVEGKACKSPCVWFTDRSVSGGGRCLTEQAAEDKATQMVAEHKARRLEQAFEEMEDGRMVPGQGKKAKQDVKAAAKEKDFRTRSATFGRLLWNPTA